MKRSCVCAEDHLQGIAEELSIPYPQASCMDDGTPQDSERIDLYYRMDGDGGRVPPCFKIIHPSCCYRFVDPQLVSFVNQGASSKGVAVFLTGPCITEHHATVEKIELQYGYDPHSREPWKFRPVDLKEITLANGVTGLIGSCPEFHIPAGVKEGLPKKRKMSMEAQREIIVRLKLYPRSDVEEYGPLQVTLIPLKAPAGQCCCVMDHQSVWEKKMNR